MSAVQLVFVLTAIGMLAYMVDATYTTARLRRELLDAKEERDAAVGSLFKLTRRCNQAEFLLKQAPLMNAPSSDFDFMNLRTKYAYIHPKSAGKVPRILASIRQEKNPNGQWILTDLVPEGGVIYSPNLMPGVKE